MPELEKLGLNIKKWFSGDLRLKLIVALGIAGMALILLSQFIGSRDARPDEAFLESAQFTAGDYTLELEAKLVELISGMDGAGETKVMITLENAGETVYAQEEKRNTDRQQEPAGAEAVGKVYQKENVEQKYIIVDSGNGKREALVKTRLEPRIQGVVVVCEGAANIRVERDIIHVVTTALNIPTTRVCVVKISK